MTYSEKMTKFSFVMYTNLKSLLLAENWENSNQEDQENLLMFEILFHLYLMQLISSVSILCCLCSLIQLIDNSCTKHPRLSYLFALFLSTLNIQYQYLNVFLNRSMLNTRSQFAHFVESVFIEPKADMTNTSSENSYYCIFRI